MDLQEPWIWDSTRLCPLPQRTERQKLWGRYKIQESSQLVISTFRSLWPLWQEFENNQVISWKGIEDSANFTCLAWGHSFTAKHQRQARLSKRLIKPMNSRSHIHIEILYTFSFVKHCPEVNLWLPPPRCWILWSVFHDRLVLKQPMSVDCTRSILETRRSRGPKDVLSRGLERGSRWHRCGDAFR